MNVEIQKNIPLKTYTSLGVGGNAQFFATVTSEEELREAVVWAKENGVPALILGGGSNVLISDEGVKGLVIRVALLGKRCAIENNVVQLSAQAGEQLDEVVAYSVEQGWWGIENLSGIPGTVGAVPVQNVGAYGVEVKDVIESVRVFNIETEAFETLSNAQCAFAYRDSIFKAAKIKKYIITEVTFVLFVNANPQITYRDLKNYFNDVIPTIAQIREAVVSIRSRKFPNWREIGTAGSFFKNPTISSAQYAELLTTYPELPGFPVSETEIKISLGWILDKALHLKGYSLGPVATYENQALVLVVKKEATALEVESFANSIIEKIKNEIGIDVEWEVSKLK